MKKADNEENLRVWDDQLKDNTTEQLDTTEQTGQTLPVSVNSISKTIILRPHYTGTKSLYINCRHGRMILGKKTTEETMDWRHEDVGWLPVAQY